MSIPIAIRYFCRLRRFLRRPWLGIRVTFRGNHVTRHLDFSKGLNRPVLLLQGFGSTRQSLLVLEQRLRAAGYDVFSVRLGGLFGTLNTRRIGRIAVDLERKLTTLRSKHNLDKVAIIGHSKGGLIGRQMIGALNGNRHCHTLITLGTPHQGYPLHQLRRVMPLGITMASVREMRPNSRFFRKLVSTPLPHNVHYVSIYSTSDRIAPPELCKWDESSQGIFPVNIKLNGISHTDYLLKQRVFEAIDEQLKQQFLADETGRPKSPATSFGSQLHYRSGQN